MKSKICIVFIIIFFTVGAMCAQDIRKPTAAGGFYPEKPEELKSMIQTYLSGAEYREFSGKLHAVIVPHAGYAYSGRVAAEAYRQLEGKKYDAVVIVAPSHYESFGGISIYPGDGLETPLGVVNIDKELAEKIEKSAEIVSFSRRGYGQEHSLEVQLPFLQTVLPNTPVVPLVMGYQNFSFSYTLGTALGEVLKDSNVLLIASSDLSHFHPYDEAVRMDNEVVEAIGNYDPFLLSQNVLSGRWEACGGGPIVAVMVAAQTLGANSVEIMQYANSGDVTGDKTSVVGYVSAVITHKPPKSQQYSLEEREILLNIACEAVENSVRGKAISPLTSLPGSLTRKSGVFVTLKINGELRGCIGEVFAENPLAFAVQSTAVKSALEDPRFKPVTEGELPKLEYDISVLSPLRLMENTDEIVIGKHGLLLINGNYSGLLLPQVPVENEWNRQEFLAYLGLKAGLPQDAWKHPNTMLFIFSAEVFGKDKM